MGKNIGKNISKNLSVKYCQKPLDHTKISATDAFKTSSRMVIQKAAEATGYLIGNKIANKITNVSTKSQKNNSETVANKHKNEIPKERYISKRKFKKIHNKIVHRQLQMRMIKKYLQKDVYFQKKDKT